MHPFSYVAVTAEGKAIGERGGESAYLAGGTTLIDLMRLGVERPTKVVDIRHVPMADVTDVNGGLRIGANVSNSELAYHPLVKDRYPVLSEAILSGASPQIRNMASTGGNLLLRTRCYYFRDTSYACNMREPGSGCSAIDGFNRIHAILGTSDKCIATHPSDMCVALAALDAVVIAKGPDSVERRIPFSDFYVAYGDDPHHWHTLRDGELIVAVELPDLPLARTGRYIKVRDRASYEFALASVAAMATIEGGNIKEARIAFGGIAAKPWRSREAEQALVGKPPTRDTFQAAADAALAGAKPQKDNAFKIELAKRTFVRALETVLAPDNLKAIG